MLGKKTHIVTTFTQLRLMEKQQPEILNLL
jgi:hypothetical protein